MYQFMVLICFLVLGADVKSRFKIASTGEIGVVYCWLKCIVCDASTNTHTCAGGGLLRSGVIATFIKHASVQRLQHETARALRRRKGIGNGLANCRSGHGVLAREDAALYINK
jgi:hypothetical protein